MGSAKEDTKDKTQSKYRFRFVDETSIRHQKSYFLLFFIL
jgi:hypothetical protein